MNPHTPGNETSEFKLAQYVVLFGGALEVIAVVLKALENVFPGAHWLALAMSISGALMAVAVALGYQKGRAALKMAALAAEASTAPARAAQPPVVGNSSSGAPSRDNTSP